MRSSTPIIWKPAKRFEPQFIFINSGETEDYLVGKDNAEVGNSDIAGRYPNNKVVKIERGGNLRYRIPVPKDLKTLELFICGKGDYEILVGGKNWKRPKTRRASAKAPLRG
jgi:hypothetical protein